MGSRTLRRFIPLLIAAVIAAFWLGSPVTYMEIPAPDGTGERLEARHARYRGFIGVMPGQGGDHPGALLLFGPSGQLCDRMAVPLVNLITDVRWETASLRLVGAGEMRRCVVRERLSNPIQDS